MTDFDLDKLRKAKAPLPRPEAKSTAISAALTAFDSAGETPVEEKSPAPAPKEPIPFDRPKRTATEKRRPPMLARPYYALAASFAALAIGIPISFQLYRQHSAPKTVVSDARPVMEPRQAAEALRQQEEQARREKVVTLPAALPPPPPATARPQAPAKPFDGRQRLGYLEAERLRELPPPVTAEQGRNRFEATPSNPVKVVTQEPVSTFSVDVDTAAYAFVRRALNGGRLPPKDAVRIEEMINYFPYAYPKPDAADAPFKPTVTVLPSPWNADNKLIHIAIKGYDLKSTDRPRANLVLLVDISGSMGPEDRLPLVKNGFKLLVETLKPDDSIAIVTYASGSDVRLPPTKVAEKAKILAAIDSLKAGGSTHGAAGIQDAYKVAEINFDKAAVNRVILATDGDWNVGITNRDELKGFIERKRQTGIFLSILGVGMGNHNDRLMQALAQNGNGVAAYIDTLNEARKVLVDEASSSLFPIAKDVKIQVEFNPALVAEYRLIGYETRVLKREDFSNDKVDAGDVGSGHSVTAIYEVTPVGKPRLVDDLRYGTPATPTAVPAPAAPAADPKTELGFLKLRYKLPKEESSRLLTLAITPSLEVPTVAAAPEDVRFSVAVAAFGQLLKGLPYMKSFSYDDVIALAAGAKGEDAFGYRAEMVNLVRLAKSAQP